MSSSNPDNLSPTLWLEFFNFSSVNVIYVLLGCVILGMSAGMIGCFAFLRKRSLLGDALSHAALPGVCAAFILFATKDPVVLLIGAMLSCWLGSLSVDWIVRYTRCKEDSALGMVLSVYFGVGILLLTEIQGSGQAAQAGLDKYLFGQAASMLQKDVWLLGIVGALLSISVLLAYKEFKIISFDPEFAQAVGIPSRIVELALGTLIVLAVCVGLQAVGVVLMAAMLVTPAAAARYWTDKLSVMLALAALFGGLSGALGAYISYLDTKMPTGPWMVVAVTSIFIVSLLFSPKRGVTPRVIRHFKFKRRTARENVLRTFYKFGEQLQAWDTAHSFAELQERRTMPAPLLRKTLARMQRKDLVTETAQGLFMLTPEGLERAARVTRLHRLWELYLTRKLEIAPDHVHDDAEEIEHILTPELEKRLLESLGYPETDPHGQRIPDHVLPLEKGSSI